MAGRERRHAAESKSPREECIFLRSFPLLTLSPISSSSSLFSHTTSSSPHLTLPPFFSLSPVLLSWVCCSHCHPSCLYSLALLLSLSPSLSLSLSVYLSLSICVCIPCKAPSSVTAVQSTHHTHAIPFGGMMNYDMCPRTSTSHPAAPLSCCCCGHPDETPQNRISCTSAPEVGEPYMCTQMS